MAIILVPQPGSAPSDLTDWENSVETLKQYNLGVNKPVDYDFTDDTIKKGVLITIGGSNYYCNADTAITGTASDYVQITSAGVASYVTDLTGVGWNDTYNFYADVTGNAYIFNEAKAGLANTAIGAFAKEAYFGDIVQLSGVTSLLATTITGDLTQVMTDFDGAEQTKQMFKSSNSAAGLSIQAKTDSVGSSYISNDYTGITSSEGLLFSVNGNNYIQVLDGGIYAYRESLSIANKAGSTIASTTTLSISTGGEYGLSTAIKELNLDFLGYEGSVKGRISAIDQTGSGSNSTMALSIMNSVGTLVEIIKLHDSSASFSGAINPTTTPTSGTWTVAGVIPRGIYSISTDYPGTYKIEQEINGVYKTIYHSTSTDQITGAVIISDGTNTKISSIGGTIHYSKF